MPYPPPPISSLSAQSPPTPATPDEISVLELLGPFIRRRKMVVLVPLLFGVAAAVLSLLLPLKYTAVATFTEEDNAGSALSGGLAGLVGLAGQFGVGGAVGGNLSPDFLASVLQSRELRDSTVTTRFPDPRRSGEQRTLLDIMDVHGKTARERLSKGVHQLGQVAEPSVDPSTGIVTLSVELRDPELAAAVANRMVQLLDQFNTTQRQTQSRQERVFVGGRLAQAEKELHEAEQEQVDFLKANRSYSDSPLLVAKVRQLERNVQTKQETFLALTKAYEDARIAEVRNTPSITIIDSAVPPAKHSSPQREFLVLLGLFIGAVVGCAGAYLLEFRRSVHRVAGPDSPHTAGARPHAWGEMVTSPTGQSEQ